MKKLIPLSFATLLLLSLFSCKKQNNPYEKILPTSVVSINGEATVKYNTGELATVLEGKTVETLKWDSGSIAAQDITALRTSCISTLKVLDLEKVNFAPGAESFEYLLGSSKKTSVIADRYTIPEGMLAKFSALNTLILPVSCKRIEDNAIRECPQLKTVDLQSVSTIEDYAFMDDSGLESVTFPSNMQKIGEEAFYLVPLKEITLPAGVYFYDDTFIYFSLASKLEKVTCKGTIPPFVDHQSVLNKLGNVFNITPNGFKILVPASAVDAYKTADKWSKHADQIFADE